MHMPMLAQAVYPQNLWSPSFLQAAFFGYDVSRLAQIYPASDGGLLRATMRVAPVGPKKPLGL
jgi:hypothetical protein